MLRSHENRRGAAVPRPLRRPSSGFTLIEVMIVVVILGALLGLAIPNYIRYQRHSKVARTAQEMRSLSSAFVAYKAGVGNFPPDSHLALPAGMAEYIDPAIWATETQLGGHYNWEGPDNYPYAGLSIFEPTATPEEIALLDNMLDDGVTATGSFRVIGARPTLIIEEP